MISRVPAGRQTNVKPLSHQMAKTQNLPPRPGEQAVLVLESRPRCDEGNHLDLTPKTRLELQSVGLGQQRHGISLADRLQKRRCYHQITQSPELHYQEIRYHSGPTRL